MLNRMLCCSESSLPGVTLSRIFDLSILSLITLNIAALMLETIPAIRQAYTLHTVQGQA